MPETILVGSLIAHKTARTGKLWDNDCFKDVQSSERRALFFLPSYASFLSLSPSWASCPKLLALHAWFGEEDDWAWAGLLPPPTGD
jgi:hypothetical protein